MRVGRALLVLTIAFGSVLPMSPVAARIAPAAGTAAPEPTPEATEPAPASTEPTTPTLRTERTYFHCVGPVKAQNVYLAQGQVPSWNTMAPTQSVQSGAGCGYYENAAAGTAQGQQTSLDGVWKGTFNGNLDSITAELHNIYVGTARASGPFSLRVNLAIDGVEVFSGPTTGSLQVTPVPSSTRASEKIAFTLTNIGLKSELGDGTTARQIQLTVRSLTEENSAWVWDTTEVPSGLTFNPAQREAAFVSVK